MNWRKSVSIVRFIARSHPYPYSESQSLFAARQEGIDNVPPFGVGRLYRLTDSDVTAIVVRNSKERNQI